ncbi:LVIVD repeat-containing protein [Persephonella sp.]
MFTFKKLSVFFFGLMVLMSGCGGGGDSSEVSTSQTVSLTGVVQLGRIAGATVEIYRVEKDGNLTLMWTETTTTGNSLEEIGNFNAHKEELEDETYYLYRAIGGQDWDADDDGVMDSNPVKNRGTLRLIAKGKDIKGADIIRITYVSEIVYEKTARYLKYSFNPATFEQKLNEAIEPVIGDINGDGVVDTKDVIGFNPVENKDSLKGLYAYKLKEIINAIHSGAYVLNSPDINHLLGSVDTPGYPRSVVISPDGNIAYVADGIEGLQVIDISDPLNPFIIATVGTTDSANAVFLSGDTVYIAAGYSGLQIVDVSQPENPQVIRSIDIQGYAMDVFVKGDTAYVVDTVNGIKKIDLINSQITTLYNSNLSKGVTLSADGNIVYVADGSNGLTIINQSTSQTYSIKTGSTATSVVLSPDETIAYIANGAGGLAIIDISDPDNLSIFSIVKFRGIARGVYLVDNTVYVTSEGSNLEIINVSDPANPVIISSIFTPGIPQDVAVLPDKKLAFVVGYNAGLQVIDVSDLVNPQIIASLDTPGSADELVLSADGSKAYVADVGSGLQIIDISDPLNPEIISSLDTENVYSLALSPDEKKVYVASGFYFHVIDIAYIKIPRIIGSVETKTNSNSTALGVALSTDGQTAYVANYGGGLLSIDVSEPTNPQIIGSVGTSGNAFKVTLSPDGSIAYVCEKSNGLQIVDIFYPSLPRIISSVETDKSTLDAAVSISGEIIYIADGRLKIVDVSDPLNPRVVSTVDTPGGANGIALSPDESIAYVADGRLGLQVIDVSDPANPRIIATIPTHGYAQEVALSPDGSMAYIAESGFGLQIIDVVLFK